MTPRRSLEEQQAQLLARLATVKAELTQKARKRRTARLIAMGVLLVNVLEKNPGIALDPWIAAAKFLDERQRSLVQEAFEEVTRKRSQSAPV